MKLVLAALFSLGLASSTAAQCGAELLTASDGQSSDHFGGDVDLAGDLFSGYVAIVGAAGDDDGASDAGAAYVLRGGFGPWAEEQKLSRPVPGTNYHFGQAVAIDGDVAVCGVPDDDDIASKAGSVDVFRFDGATWNHEQQLTASDAAASDRFGWAVDVRGSVIVVGAKFDDDTQSNSGSVYVFRFDGSSWVEEQKLVAPDPAQHAQFGDAVAMDGDGIVVGAWQDDDAGPLTGAAYVFHYDGGSWGLEGKLNASDQDQFHLFGRSVTINGDLVVCGAPGADVGALQAGAAYAFRRSGTTWTETAKIVADSPLAGAEFGWAVHLFDGFEDRLVVGAPRNDFPLSEGGSISAFYYPDTFGLWNQFEESGWDNATGDHLGRSVVLGEGFSLAGAPDADTADGVDAGGLFTVSYDAFACGGGSNSCDCSGGNSPCGNVSSSGRGCRNSNPNGLGARLYSSGGSSISFDSFELFVQDAALNKPGLLLAGTASLGPFGIATVPESAGVFCVAGTTRRDDVVITDGTGRASFPDFLGAPFGQLDIVISGTANYYTYWFRDPGTAAGCGTDGPQADFNFSNAVGAIWN